MPHCCCTCGDIALTTSPWGCWWGRARGDTATRRRRRRRRRRRECRIQACAEPSQRGDWPGAASNAAASNCGFAQELLYRRHDWCLRNRRNDTTISLLLLSFCVHTTSQSSSPKTFHSSQFPTLPNFFPSTAASCCCSCCCCNSASASASAPSSYLPIVASENEWMSDCTRARLQTVLALSWSG